MELGEFGRGPLAAARGDTITAQQRGPGGEIIGEDGM
jgi:hypothetical protein